MAKIFIGYFYMDRTPKILAVKGCKILGDVDPRRRDLCEAHNGGVTSKPHPPIVIKVDKGMGTLRLFFVCPSWSDLLLDKTETELNSAIKRDQRLTNRLSADGAKFLICFA